ncbi:cupin domain-containing protein [Pedobacter sp. L105]|uniref:cupin domain-containing protein n=1 Tax=Pedobacter sp. L105 TaxID=1641871 RepID=UPI001C207976|nr:cupin domain-containing protein [Pedobacter sp. L105]
MASGILEAYVRDETTAEQNAEIRLMADMFSNIDKKISDLYDAMEKDALDHAGIPDSLTGPFVVATADYIGRLNKGEPFVMAPELSASSTITEYQGFIDSMAPVAHDEVDEIHARIISAIPDRLMTAIVYLRKMAPQETHDDEFERFLILEGTCTITIEDAGAFDLVPGSYLQIPLHKKHHVIVTSLFPCKILLQRVKVAA